MTDKATLLALAERVEAVTGPDERLDREVAAAVQDAIEAATGRCPPLHHGAFTASLDAAMTLVPVRHNWSVRFSDLTQGEAWIFPPNNEALVQFYADAATPALALCAAALRARAEAQP